jgi:hypothetical protein
VHNYKIVWLHNCNIAQLPYHPNGKLQIYMIAWLHNYCFIVHLKLNFKPSHASPRGAKMLGTVATKFAWQPLRNTPQNIHLHVTFVNEIPRPLTNIIKCFVIQHCYIAHWAYSLLTYLLTYLLISYANPRGAFASKHYPLYFKRQLKGIAKIIPKGVSIHVFIKGMFQCSF